MAARDYVKQQQAHNRSQFFRLHGLTEAAGEEAEEQHEPNDVATSSEQPDNTPPVVLIETTDYGIENQNELSEEEDDGQLLLQRRARHLSNVPACLRASLAAQGEKQQQPKRSSPSCNQPKDSEQPQCCRDDDESSSEEEKDDDQRRPGCCSPGRFRLRRFEKSTLLSASDPTCLIAESNTVRRQQTDRRTRMRERAAAVSVEECHKNMVVDSGKAQDEYQRKTLLAARGDDYTPLHDGPLVKREQQVFLSEKTDRLLHELYDPPVKQRVVNAIPAPRPQLVPDLNSNLPVDFNADLLRHKPKLSIKGEFHKNPEYKRMLQFKVDLDAPVPPNRDDARQTLSRQLPDPREAPLVRLGVPDGTGAPEAAYRNDPDPTRYAIQQHPVYHPDATAVNRASVHGDGGMSIPQTTTGDAARGMQTRKPTYATMGGAPNNNDIQVDYSKLPTVSLGHDSRKDTQQRQVNYSDSNSAGLRGNFVSTSDLHSTRTAPQQEHQSRFLVSQQQQPIRYVGEDLSAGASSCKTQDGSVREVSGLAAHRSEQDGSLLVQRELTRADDALHRSGFQHQTDRLPTLPMSDASALQHIAFDRDTRLGDPSRVSGKQHLTQGTATTDGAIPDKMLQRSWKRMTLGMQQREPEYVTDKEAVGGATLDDRFTQARPVAPLSREGLVAAAEQRPRTVQQANPVHPPEFQQGPIAAPLDRLAVSDHRDKDQRQRPEPLNTALVSDMSLRGGQLNSAAGPRETLAAKNIPLLPAQAGTMNLSVAGIDYASQTVPSSRNQLVLGDTNKRPTEATYKGKDMDIQYPHRGAKYTRGIAADPSDSSQHRLSVLPPKPDYYDPLLKSTLQPFVHYRGGLGGEDDAGKNKTVGANTSRLPDLTPQERITVEILGSSPATRPVQRRVNASRTNTPRQTPRKQLNKQHAGSGPDRGTDNIVQRMKQANPLLPDPF